MPPNYRGLLAIIPPAVPQGSHQPVSGPEDLAELRFCQILAGPLPV